jgi:TonB-linked SusC/RagA family outer membrane protein
MKNLRKCNLKMLKMRIGRMNTSLRAMLTLLLLSPFISLQTNAAEIRSYAERTNLTLNLKDATIQEVLMEIERLSEFYFSYSTKQIESDRKVNIHLNNETVQDALDELFNGRGVKYTIDDRHIILFKTDDGANETFALQQQGRRITGTVKDEFGETIPGASIVEKGTTNGIITDGDGNFSLTLTQQDATLQISYMGFKSLEISTVGAGDGKPLIITLSEDIQALDEVVVVGYGMQKKAHLTGSVTAVKAEEIKSVPAGNLTNALSGRLSGVSIRQTGGGRPGNSSTMSVRAIGTWNSTTPLYVIDGIVRDSRAFDMLNSSEVENISILKDAAAATVYGARAANGVILVTTKKGQEGKTTVTYSGSVSMGEMSIAPKRESLQTRIVGANFARREVYDCEYTFDVPGYEGYKVPNKSTNYKIDGDPTSGYRHGDVFTDEAVAYYKSYGDGYNALEEVYRTPVTDVHSVDVNGGTDRVKYYAGANYYNETGVFKSQSYNKYSIRTNIETKIAHGLTASLSLNTNKSQDRKSSQDDDTGRTVFWKLMASTRLYPSKVDGKYIGFSTNNDGIQMGDASAAADADGVSGYTDNIYISSEYTANLKWELPWVKGLTASATYNKFERNYELKHNVIPYETWKLVKAPKELDANQMIIYPTEIDYASGPTTRHNKGSLQEHRSNTGAYQLNAALNYAATFGKHDVAAMFNYEQYEYFSEMMIMSVSEMQINTLPYFQYGETDLSKWRHETDNIKSAGSEDARLSVLGRLNYAYDGKYLAEFSFRNDASVKFAPKHRWGFFPSASLAWRISEESFLRDNIPAINNLKLRGSIGLTGNDAVGSFQWMERASIGGAYYIGGSAALPTSNITTEANPSITWEKSQNYNYGFDLGFLNAFTLGFDGYFRHTYDILGSQTSNLPDVFGGKLSDSNYGIVDSWGWEVELGYNKSINKDLSVYAKGNFSFADNKLVEYVETGVPDYLSRIGKNWDRVAGLVSDGIVTQVQRNDMGNGTYTYTVTTSTGNVYKNLPRDYTIGNSVWGDNRGFDDAHRNSIGPGMIWIKDLRYLDANGNLQNVTDGTATDDRQIDPGDIDTDWIIDRLIPPYAYGLQFGGVWKNLSLDILLQGTGGNQTYGFIGNEIENGARGSMPWWYTADAYSFFENPQGQYPRMNNASSKPGYDYWIRDASFLRLKNVTLSYLIPKKILSKIGITEARIYCTGNNLALLWNPMKYYDPELVGDISKVYKMNDWQGSQYDSYAGTHNLPLMRTVTFGINVSF